MRLGDTHTKIKQFNLDKENKLASWQGISSIRTCFIFQKVAEATYYLLLGQRECSDFDENSEQYYGKSVCVWHMNSCKPIL